MSLATDIAKIEYVREAATGNPREIHEAAEMDHLVSTGRRGPGSWCDGFFHSRGPGGGLRRRG